MRVNEKIAVSTSKVLLVPYEAHQVLTYHGWMQDPVLDEPLSTWQLFYSLLTVQQAIQEATASEPMTLEEEYENQQSWRTSHDKLTFIVCEPLSGEQQSNDARVITAKIEDSPDKMKGDVNFFLYLDDDDDEDGAEQRDGSHIRLRGEIDVMIAGQQHRGKGTGEAAVRTILAYIRSNLAGILQEYAQGESLDGDKIQLVGLMAKIKEDNTGSRGLFKKLGFRQEGEANYFGEVKMVMSWEEVEGMGIVDGLEYEEVSYMM